MTDFRTTPEVKLDLNRREPNTGTAFNVLESMHSLCRHATYLIPF